MFNLEQYVIGRSKRRRLSYVQRTVPHTHTIIRGNQITLAQADKIYERFHTGLIKGFITDGIVEQSTKEY